MFVLSFAFYASEFWPYLPELDSKKNGVEKNLRFKFLERTECVIERERERDEKQTNEVFE